ncbi:N-lysine methyltransferase KMT5A-like [Diadema setosum]|uniref:N-lysine methyltransferase KMT5A-like n=1 Tax=Diadema setosum TaxID=31175 RepID=UPI003B3A718D
MGLISMGSVEKDAGSSINTEAMAESSSKRMVTRSCAVKTNRKQDEYKKYLDKDDPQGLEVKQVNKLIGCGIFATRSFTKGEFLLQYKGDVISEEEAATREERYKTEHHYQFFYSYRGKTMCIDATETKSNGRFVNDAKEGTSECNSRMRKVEESGKVFLCLFAIKDIKVGDEIRYDYKAPNLWWRRKCRRRNNESEQLEQTKESAEHDVPLLSEVAQTSPNHHSNEASEGLGESEQLQKTRISAECDLVHENGTDTDCSCPDQGLSSPPETQMAVRV